MEEKELTKLEKDITSYYDDVRQNEERIRYLQEKLGKKEIEESEWIRQKEELADIKQQIKELDSSILLLTHQIETISPDARSPAITLMRFVFVLYPDLDI